MNGRRARRCPGRRERIEDDLVDRALGIFMPVYSALNDAVQLANIVRANNGLRVRRAARVVKLGQFGPVEFNRHATR